MPTTTGEKRIYSKILDFLLPKFCVHCGKYGHYLCQECYNQINFVKTHLCPYCRRPSVGGLTHPGCLTKYAINGIYSAAFYKGPMRSLIKTLKYHPFPFRVYEEIEIILKRYFTDQERFFPKEAVIIPIPMHPEKKKKRKFNQSQLIANTLQSIWKNPLQDEILIRTRRGRVQAGLSRRQRYQNVRGLFQIHPQKRKLVEGNSFILVDDIVTSGATLKWCAFLLKKNHAGKVWGVTLARD